MSISCYWYQVFYDENDKQKSTIIVIIIIVVVAVVKSGRQKSMQKAIRSR